MNKIPTVLVRDPDDRAHVLPEVTPGCEWVIAGEGVATRKYDGTCMMLDDDGVWWARREVKPGKTPPPTFKLISTDEVTGKSIGWERATDSPFAKFLDQAVNSEFLDPLTPGTYELFGPKINGNPEHYDEHLLTMHGEDVVVEPDGPRSVEDIVSAVRAMGARGKEGIVWHHPDGRMAKLKARDIKQEEHHG